MKPTLKKRLTSFKPAAINTGPLMNHLDHLVSLCYVMGMPLITDEENIYQAAKKYYPEVTPILRKTFTLSYLAENYDLLFVSSKRYSQELSAMIEMSFKKQVRFFYCPHGNSDKGLLSPTMDPLPFQKRLLIYGPQMKRRLEDRISLSKLDSVVTTGNYRLEYYKTFKPFFDEITDAQVFSKFAKQQPTILYAPTWQDEEESSSFKSHFQSLIKSLPKHYNLIIKLHPLLMEHSPGEAYCCIERCRDHPQIQVLNEFPLVFPLLNRTNIYLGDFSSIGYDFLAFNRPMFFFNPTKREKGRDLHRCGMEITEPNVFDFIDRHKDQTDLTEERRKTFSYAFGDSISLKTLKQLILSA